MTNTTPTVVAIEVIGGDTPSDELLALLADMLLELTDTEGNGDS